MANHKTERLCWYCTASSDTDCRLISIHFVLARPGDLSKGHVQDLAHAQRRLVATGFEIEGYSDLVVGRQVADLRQKGEV